MKQLRIVPAFFGYAFYLLGHLALGLLTVLLVPLALLFPDAARRCLAFLLSRYLRFLTMVWLPTLGTYLIAEVPGRFVPGPAVFVANHRSRIDAPLLLSLIPRCGVVIKGVYARTPLYAAFVHFFDFVAVDSGKTASLVAALSRSNALLKAGRSLLVFPEGTRASSGRILPFREFAFRVARDAGVPVVPLVVHTDLPFMARRPGSLVPPRRMALRVRMLDAFQVSPTERPSDAAARAERAIAAALSDMDRDTAWEKPNPGIRQLDRSRPVG